MWRLTYALKVWWYRLDKAALAFLVLVGLVLSGGAFAVREVFIERDQKVEQLRAFHAQHLDCLARNVYFEARGEPLAGQYAVAEVTMNRKASPLYPSTVCEVVYQKNWDPIRGRYVGAFSWTEFDSLPEPSGEEWARAKQVAEQVYYERYSPTLQGALFFHATHIRPEWAKAKKLVSRIGRHVFYR